MQVSLGLSGCGLEQPLSVLCPPRLGSSEKSIAGNRRDNRAERFCRSRNLSGLEARCRAQELGCPSCENSCGSTPCCAATSPGVLRANQGIAGEAAGDSTLGPGRPLFPVRSASCDRIPGLSGLSKSSPVVSFARHRLLLGSGSACSGFGAPQYGAARSRSSVACPKAQRSAGCGGAWSRGTGKGGGRAGSSPPPSAGGAFPGSPGQEERGEGSVVTSTSRLHRIGGIEALSRCRCLWRRRPR